MTPEENRRRSVDEHVRYIKNHLCDKDSNKPYVFISYKSDDWETVLHDIVYRLLKEHGLNVYFDGSFDTHNDLWISQFPENMENYNCKGVIAFVDDKYATSYATLLELMYSQTQQAGKKVVQVNLDKLTAMDGAEGEINTGLGVKNYEDGTVNLNAGTEKSLFDETFEELVDIGVFKEARHWYKRDRPFTKKRCSNLVKNLLAHLKINENYYNGPDGDLEGIIGSIQDALGKEVFHREKPDIVIEKETVVVRFRNDEQVQEFEIEKGRKLEEPAEPKKDGKVFRGWHELIPDVDGGRKWDFRKDVVGFDMELLARWEPVVSKPDSGTISLTDFLAKYGNNTFKKDTFAKFRLVGAEGYERYGTEFCDSAFDLAWGFVMKLLAERGMDFIREVNERHQGLKNPVFISQDIYDRREDQNKYRKIEAEGVEGYYMYRHYGQYQWIDAVLKPRLLEFGLPIDRFSFAYTSEEGAGGSGQKEVPGTDLTETAGSDEAAKRKGGTEKPVDQGKDGEDIDVVQMGGRITGPVTLSGGGPVEKISGRHRLSAFLEEYNNKKFQSKSCSHISLIGVNGCERYSLERDGDGKAFGTARQLVFCFAMSRIDEMGMAYIERVNGDGNMKNPIFITQEEHQARKERKESVTYTTVTSQAVSGYSMCTHYSEYDWLKNSLTKQLKALGLSQEDFYLEFE